LRRHPEILDWLHRQRGEASTRISLALQDWLHLASDRWTTEPSRFFHTYS